MCQRAATGSCFQGGHSRRTGPLPGRRAALARGSWEPSSSRPRGPGTRLLLSALLRPRGHKKERNGGLWSRSDSHSAAETARARLSPAQPSRPAPPRGAEPHTSGAAAALPAPRPILRRRCFHEVTCTSSRSRIFLPDSQAGPGDARFVKPHPRFLNGTSGLCAPAPHPRGPCVRFLTG